jgi:hypothetical protein
VGKNKNIIDINGKRYDARTGAMLSHGKAKDVLPGPSQAMKPQVKKPTMRDVVRHPAKPASVHKTTPSKTLMRTAVKKPSADKTKVSKRKIKAQGPSETSAVIPLADIVISKSAKQVDSSKLAHATKVPKSQLIAHFSPVTSDINSPEPVVAVPQVASDKPKTLAKQADKTAAQSTAELLDHAIIQASTHQEAPLKKPRNKRKIRAAIASVTAIALIAFVGYQELPNMKLNIASAKAGFSAGKPSYQPPGYSFGKLSYSTGVVATKFTSNSDERSYTITQKVSTWDSQALKANFVVKTSGTDYQTIETGGRTIYLYNNGNATWVNGGVWFIVQSNGSLSNHQLVELAKSI